LKVTNIFVGLSVLAVAVKKLTPLIERQEGRRHCAPKEDQAKLRKVLDAARGLRDAIADQSGVWLLSCRESDAISWLFGSGSTSSARETAARAESAGASARVGNVRDDRVTS
jgi:hypothetical protein